MAIPNISTLLQFLLFMNPSINLHVNFKTENCLIFDSNTSLPSFNRVCHNQTPTTHEIEHIKDHFKKRPFTWFVKSKNKKQRHLLEKNNLNYRGSFPLMTLNLNALKQPKKASEGTITITVIDPTNAELLNQWSFIISQAFFLSQTELIAVVQHFNQLMHKHLKLYLGVHEGKAVTAGMLIQHDTTVTIHKMATLPEYRKKGFGTWLLYTMIHDAKQSGCKYAALFASQKGFSLYKRIGFKKHTLYDIYGNY